MLLRYVNSGTFNYNGRSKKDFFEDTTAMEHIVSNLELVSMFKACS